VNELYSCSADNPPNDLSVQVQLTGAGAASRRYGAVIIQQSKYRVDFELTSDSTTEGTSLTGRGAVLIEGTADSFSLAGIGLEGLDKDQLLDKLNEAYSGAEFSAAFTEYTTDTQKTVQVTTTGLNAGKFIVLVGVWEGASDKLVAFHQREVTVSGPPSLIIPPTAPPTPEQIQGMGDAEAASVCVPGDDLLVGYEEGHHPEVHLPERVHEGYPDEDAGPLGADEPAQPEEDGPLVLLDHPDGGGYYPPTTTTAKMISIISSNNCATCSRIADTLRS
jgi:hypothetical protein